MQVKHFFLAGTITLLASCNSQTRESTGEADSTTQSASSFDASSFKSNVDQNNRAFEEAFNNGDSTKVASFYASDAWLMPPNHEMVKGQNDIAAAWGSFYRMGVKGMQLNTEDVSGSGDMAVEVGTYTVLGADKNPLDNGKYVVVWKKEGNEWKLYRDIWNSNQPPAGQ